MPRPTIRSPKSVLRNKQHSAYVDIAEGFEHKIAARLAHESQTPDPGTLTESWRTRAHAIGAPVGLELAESFTVLHLY